MVLYVVCDAHYVNVYMVEEKELIVYWVWKTIRCVYRIKKNVEDKDWLKDKYQYFISILLCMWFMILVYDDYMWSMILVYDGYMWFMMLIYAGCVFRSLHVICLYMMIWSKMLVDLLWQEVYKTTSVPYWRATNDVWCEFISIYFKSNGNYVFGTGMHKHARVGWLKPTTRISSISERNWNMHEYVGKHFRSRAIVGHWYPIVSIDFHEHVMNYMMVLRQRYALFFVSYW